MNKGQVLLFKSFNSNNDNFISEVCVYHVMSSHMPEYTLKFIYYFIKVTTNIY